DAMAIRAAHSIADFAEKQGISQERIMPTMMDSDLFPNVAADVAMQAIQDGVARKNRTWQEVYNIASKDIQETHELVELFQEKGYIRQFPEEMVNDIIKQVCAEL
ncbi:MAG: hypothetical protein J5799_05095, partial [Bacteroidales bacterium]|nr:hypothetical protein [Bacteroidales bacterium]